MSRFVLSGMVDANGSFIELPASVRPSDTTDSLLEHSRLKKGVLVAHEAVRKTYMRLFSGPLYEGVIVKIE